MDGDGEYRLQEGLAFGVKLYIKCFFFALVLAYGGEWEQDCQDGEEIVNEFL